MAGAPSQLDLFDYKPELARLEGKPLPPEVIAGQRYAFIRPDAAVLGPRFKFAKHGQSGAELSEVLPHLAKVADDVSFLKAVHTDQFNHAPAQIFFNTGFSQPGRPSIGSLDPSGAGKATRANCPATKTTSGAATSSEKSRSDHCRLPVTLPCTHLLIVGPTCLFALARIDHSHYASDPLSARARRARLSTPAGSARRGAVPHRGRIQQTLASALGSAAVDSVALRNLRAALFRAAIARLRSRNARRDARLPPG